jgi:hypothetical protein
MDDDTWQDHLWLLAGASDSTCFQSTELFRWPVVKCMVTPAISSWLYIGAFG